MAIRRALTAVALLAGGLVLVHGASPVTAGGGGCHQELQREGSGDMVTASLNCFTPTVLRVEPGAEVSFVNKDAIEHAVAGVGGGWSNTELFGSEAVFRARFDEPGVYVYTCPIHPGMAGAVVVGDGRSVNSPIPVAVTTPLAVAPAAVTSDAGDSSSAAGPALFVGGLALGLLGGWRLRRRPLPH